MATYAIGDIHGCYAQLQGLLDKIKFDPTQDILWFTGDLINGGPQPAETIRFIQSLGTQHVCVLGNHDVVLLGVAAGKIPAPRDRKIGMEPVLMAPDRDELIAWLRQRPMVHFDVERNVLLVHAGVLPQWTLPQIQNYAHEIETLLRKQTDDRFVTEMFGNEPAIWNEQLTGMPRIRFLLNCFTRMRFCTADGKLDLTTKGEIDNAPSGYQPWFKFNRPHTEDIKIIFGHWAALLGNTGVANAINIDTGCVWGHELTAVCLDDWRYFQVKSQRQA